MAQILGGYLSNRFGGKIMNGIGNLMNGVMTIISPMAARIHPGALFIVRVLLGIAQVR